MALIPADRLVNWTPGTYTGVIGGIPTNRSDFLTISVDNTGSTDVTAGIQAAINAVGSHDGVLLPAGRYRCDNTVLLPTAFSGKTFKGAGPTLTSIVQNYSGQGTGLIAGDPSGIAPPQVTPMRVLTGLTAGSTSITVDPDTSGLSNGQLIYLMIESDLTLPVVSVYNFNVFTNESPHVQQVRITSMTSDTLNFTPPLFQDYSGEVRVMKNTFWATGIGIEDLTMDATGQPSTLTNITMASCYGSWIKNCNATLAKNYPINIQYCLNCEFRHNTIQGQGGSSSNGAGFLTGMHSGLIEDNIILDCFPNIEVNLGSAGNVIAYNYGPDDQTWNTNHAPHNQYNLYEGNAIGFFISDGYFGSEAKATYFRNYTHGTITGVNLRRFIRKASVVGNMHDAGTGVGCGLPNIGNGDSTGTAQLSMGDPWLDWQMTGTLTTRTDNDNGVVTLASGHLINPDMFTTQLISLTWGAGLDHSCGASVSAVTGNVATIVRTAKENLPTQGTTVLVGAGSSYFGTGSGSFQELDLDVAATLVKKGNRYLVDNSFDSLGGDPLPDSLYTDRAGMVNRGVTWGSLTFPPFDPVTPVDPKVTNIPAGYRALNGVDPGGSLPDNVVVIHGVPLL